MGGLATALHAGPTSHLSGDPYVGERLSVGLPLADVQQPLRRRRVLEQVAHLQTTTSRVLWVFLKINYEKFGIPTRDLNRHLTKSLQMQDEDGKNLISIFWRLLENIQM